jgi:hypothetical protein
MIEILEKSHKTQTNDKKQFKQLYKINMIWNKVFIIIFLNH